MNRVSRIAHRASSRAIAPLALFLALTAGCETQRENGKPDPFGALFEKMGKPQQGDWLYVHDEPGQTFEQYRASKPNRKTEKRKRIYLLPMGKIAESEPSLLPALKEFIEAFFETPVTLEDSGNIPENAINVSRRQHHAGDLLDHVASGLQEDAAARIGFIEYDLYHEKLNFVFGLGAFDERRSGVYSIARYRFEYINQSKDVTLLRRSLKVAAHELGHIFGLAHCRKWRCIMNGSNSILEADRRPMFLCPECLEKLRWNLGFDPGKRYDALARFYAKHTEFQTESCRAKQLKAVLAGD